MTGREMRETARNIRADEFLQARADAFTGIVIAVQLIADLHASVGKVQVTYQKQIVESENVRYDYDGVRDAYQDLLADTRDVANLAVSIAKREKGFDDLFPSPSGSSRRKLIAEARAAADNAEDKRKKFMDRGMETDFIEQLRQKADILETALNHAAASTGNRVGATDTLGKDVHAASDIVEEIDPMVKKVYQNDPTNLAAWKFASHVERHTPVPKLPKSPQ